MATQKHHVVSVIANGKVIGEDRLTWMEGDTPESVVEAIRLRRPTAELLYISLQNGPIQPIEEESP